MCSVLCTLSSFLEFVGWEWCVFGDLIMSKIFKLTMYNTSIDYTRDLKIIQFVQ
jgi:hypothetical protein